MASGASLKIIGDWKKEIGVPLKDALAVSMDVTGKTGERACRDVLIGMAQSARKIANKSKKNRKIQRDEHGQYVENWRRGKTQFQKLYKWMFDPENVQEFVGGSWENARRIGNQGLAKRSWMWGLARLKPIKTGKAIRGASKVIALKTPNANGYIKENRLDYILKSGVMPGGWENIVQTRAGNRIMAQARNKLESKWRREMGMPRRKRKEPARDNAFLAQYFLKGGGLS